MASRVAAYGDELVAFRRDLHMHPELGREEFRTTKLIHDRLVKAGLTPRLLPGTGVVCDILPARGSGDGRGTIAFRGDIDALPVEDQKDVAYRSQVPGAAHACGHDLHTAVTLGAGLVLADLAREGRLPRPVRLIFQPAEEKLPGGALDVIKAGGLDGVEEIHAVHCDPGVEVGRVALRVGAITSACDRLIVTLGGPGGHTARPHQSTDLVTALAKMAGELPAALARRIDPRSGVSIVWGRIAAGSAPNVIPQRGELDGTLRCLDLEAWRQAPDLLQELIDAIASTYGAKWELEHHRGVPPVVNEAGAVAAARGVAAGFLGADAIETTGQSLGGEDFSWYLEDVPGQLTRLGVRAPGEAPYDLHQGRFDADERAIGVGVRLFAGLATRAPR
ncbi:amidohydrolase [Yinghuangia sp. KLBMP8922]|uniref:Amidohydrolase n=1 Tax=Yinghuangia soli TaxID=2908204 RepID=A0AA41Q1W2_9ACTN|nr:amidohydrolase [Yinghuangia soli]MCF2529781.1 amidohydrolase [Yinghuangia soli]